ncbi:MAG TPA: YHYH protein [Candidatus Saccharimonadales bacterium]|nr:YHYH protein [Candidatus Saccharimonadales bacterium]
MSQDSRQSPLSPDNGLSKTPLAGQSPGPSQASPRSYNKLINVVLTIVVLGVVASALYWALGGKSQPAANTAQMSAVSQSKKQPVSIGNSTAQTSSAIQLDPNKNYGNKYARGVLPVGDGKYTSSGPKQGYIYACAGYANNLASRAGGAGRRGPWFIGTTKYDINKKLHVQGAKLWQADFSNRVSGTTRTIITNDLPSKPTGVFPISPTDPAYAYDRNPNNIQGQTFTYKLDANPTSGNPSCIGGDVGIMLTGVVLFSGLDAGGRDAGAWEVQDSCDGHPQSDGIYHYHTLSSCINNISVKTVIGFALDGFPITGPKVGEHNFLTTDDLDECHGLTSQVVLDGKKVTTYHYVMTQDYPYSISCFRATPIKSPTMPKQPAAGRQQP